MGEITISLEEYKKYIELSVREELLHERYLSNRYFGASDVKELFNYTDEKGSNSHDD